MPREHTLTSSPLPIQGTACLADSSATLSTSTMSTSTVSTSTVSTSTVSTSTVSTSAESTITTRAQRYSLDQLSDEELLAQTRHLVGHSNRVLSALLAHLAEVETRGVHRIRACSSLYTYCIYELRLSEDEAARRVSAARLVKRFPVLFAAVERGELHLTGLLLLGPHLTAENHSDVLARAKHRTKKEIQKLVRELSPWPDVPARIEPLGPAGNGAPDVSPSWGAWVQSLCPVRELSSGDRPADWLSEPTNGVVKESDEDAGAMPREATAPARDESYASRDDTAPARVEPPWSELRSEDAAPAAPDSVTGPQRYRVQFSAGEEYVALVERARALLSHVAPNTPLEDLHLRAMRALVLDLEKRRYAVTEQPRCANVESPERERRRAVPAEVRRAVFERDGGRCTYEDDRGQRCRETHRLELHHVEPFAKGGAHHAANIRLCCAAHNTLAAEQDFGRLFMRQRQAASRHASVASQGRGFP